MDEKELNLYLEAGETHAVIRKLHALYLNHAMQIKSLEGFTVKLTMQVTYLERRIEQLEKRNN